MLYNACNPHRCYKENIRSNKRAGIVVSQSVLGLAYLKESGFPTMSDINIQIGMKLAPHRFFWGRNR